MSVMPKRANSGSVAEIKPESGAGMMIDAGSNEAGSARPARLIPPSSALAMGMLANGMSPAARKAPAAVPRASVISRALIGDSNRECDLAHCEKNLNVHLQDDERHPPTWCEPPDQKPSGMICHTGIPAAPMNNS